jgi:uncharacterized membrane protein
MKSKPTWLEGILLLAPFIALAIFWRGLPARIPMHWNLRNQVDGWGSKGSGLLLLPLLNVGIVALLHLLPRLDPKLRKSAGETNRMPAVLAVLGVTLAAFGDAIFCTQLLAALGHAVPVSRIAVNACLFLFAVLGNYSATLRPNYFVGIRTPWTLESPETWRATHRLAGRLMFFGSLFLFVLQFFLNETLFAVLVFGLLLVWTVWTFWYSWHHFQALQLAAQ